MEVKLMFSGKNLTIIGFVVVVFVILQGILISVGKTESPANAAVDFAKAYFMLDGPSMSQHLCNEIAEDEELNIVKTYLNSVADQARLLGFSENYMQNQLSRVSTEIQMVDENNAEVRITGERFRSLNPVFALIGRLFFLIETHDVEETLSLVKE
ncbi:MAG: hypothetical protein R3274_10960, partial [Desulfobacterales bacterium]|nr:hypothetical protein [Desulfobacterales bacterium]